ncbi:long-chain fatty acid--CoA ligase, partial [Streptomyces sp. SID11233]|nr:long-chain fatty acid--CoA ligase [Streptomyces sp. SID11233]
GSHLDADGWFATGDVGRMEPDGRLVLIDRIKDVFKRDNLLVSPGAIEKRLRAHPAVAECVVVDYPDKFAGAVAAAFVVPEPGFEDRQIDEIV